jgi:eukaryotic-like serine/threonine-protein kinase
MSIEDIRCSLIDESSVVTCAMRDLPGNTDSSGNGDHMTDDSMIGQLAEEFTSRVRKGELPDVEEYVNRYPQLAGRIRELFPMLMLLEGIGDTRGSAAIPAVSSPLSENSAFGSYHIKREIGRGGMGIVYEAVHVLLEKRVALKVLPVGTLAGADQLERFFREARMAAGLHHANIVSVFDVGQIVGTPYYAMQYIEGSSLDQILRIIQSASETDAVDPSARIQAGLPGNAEDYFRWVSGIGIQAAEGLAYAHERKIIHRDIKPSNLLLDNEGVLRIADFGLARKIEDPALTQSGVVLGTPRYMSPEQAESAMRPVDQRSDIYSLGATLYELLTCRPVFEGKTPQEVLSQIITREPIAPRQLNPKIPADLAVIVMKAMAKRPEDRYQSARDLADDLEHWRKMEPIKARPIGSVGRIIRWCHRNPRIPAMFKTTAYILVLILFTPEVYVLRKIRYKIKKNQKIRSAFTRAELIAAISAVAAVIIISLSGVFLINLNIKNQEIAALKAALRDKTEENINRATEVHSIICTPISGERTHGIVCELMQRGSNESAPPDTPASRADSFSEMRFDLARGSFTKAQGFLLTSTKRSAILDRESIMKMWNSQIPVITLSLEWKMSETP